MTTNEQRCFRWLRRELEAELGIKIGVSLHLTIRTPESTLKVYHYIRRHMEVKHYAPTLRQIADHFGWRSAHSAQRHVNTLIKTGRLVRPKRKASFLVVPDLR